MRMLRETGDIKAESEFLGHSGVAITEHLYLDADTARQREAMERRNEGVRRRREELDLTGSQPRSSPPTRKQLWVLKNVFGRR